MLKKHDWSAVVVAYSPSSAAIATDLKLHRIQSAIRSGALKAVRVGVKTRVTRSAIEAWLDTFPAASRRASTGGTPHA
jgi:excisionase family DNA binding protein